MFPCLALWCVWPVVCTELATDPGEIGEIETASSGGDGGSTVVSGTSSIATDSGKDLNVIFDDDTEPLLRQRREAPFPIASGPASGGDGIDVSSGPVSISTDYNQIISRSSRLTVIVSHRFQKKYARFYKSINNKSR